ncbi:MULTISPECIES: DUF2069 domain-containing protein [unclassified Hahella]|uniref:DUF2069 domain-containing protein n=1 Tax=unclassified Hahella TaxID=2624107 RepID=UPI0013E3D37A|nr:MULTISPECIES: DUF2069 domain-containing protein [unclassified Hahella]MDG9671509.1 DUF2069 domain-containing protein [Hahella sp. CR1]
MSLSQKVKIARSTVTASYLILTLLVLFSTWQSISQNTETSWLLIVSVKCLPLLAFFPAVYLGHVRGLIWLCFVLCLYFIRAVGDYAAGQNLMISGALAVMSVILFSTILCFIKWNAQARRAA